LTEDKRRQVLSKASKWIPLRILTACLSRDLMQFFANLSYMMLLTKTDEGEEVIAFVFARSKDDEVSEGKGERFKALRRFQRSVANEFGGEAYRDEGWDVVYIPLREEHRREMRSLLRKLGVM